jgi:hypothetical protein
MNNLTACFLWRSKLPFAFPTDSQCLQCAVETCWQPIPEKLKFVVLPNTLEVNEIWVSQALLAEAKGNPDLEIVGETKSLPFDAKGNLEQEKLFPHSWRARRTHA